MRNIMVSVVFYDLRPIGLLSALCILICTRLKLEEHKEENLQRWLENAG